MKSSTIRRSTLSKESMEVIENLSKDSNINEQEYYTESDTAEENNIPEPINKDREIDLLWQNFKPAQLTSNSSLMYTIGGFIGGVITTVLVFGIIAAIFSGSNGSLGQRIKAKFNKQHNEVIYDQQTEYVENESAKIVVPDDSSEQPTVSQSNEGETDSINQETVNSTPDLTNTKKYIVKNGDTGESIIKKTYGHYSVEKAEQIMKLNNLKTLDRINIDQELLLPVE